MSDPRRLRFLIYVFSVYPFSGSVHDVSSNAFSGEAGRITPQCFQHSGGYTSGAYAQAHTLLASLQDGRLANLRVRSSELESQC